MEFIPVGIGLIPIIIAVLLGPLLVKKIEHNLEAFLFLMGACAIVISRSWHIGLVEDAVWEPIVIGMMLFVLVAGLVVHYYRSQFLHWINENLVDGIAIKVIFLEIVIVLGLSAAIVTPILPFFVLVEVVNHLPIPRKTRASLTLLASISIIFGAALALAAEPYATIAAVKMQGTLPSANFLPEMQILFIPCIVLLGLISMFFGGEKVGVLDAQNSDAPPAFKSGAILSARMCMFVGALLLVGVAFGVGFW